MNVHETKPHLSRPLDRRLEDLTLVNADQRLPASAVAVPGDDR